MNWLKLSILTACCLVVALVTPGSGADDPAPAAAPAPAGEKAAADRAVNPLYIILDSPKDLNALLQKIQLPDLEVRRAQGRGSERAADTKSTSAEVKPWVIKSVAVRGTVGPEVADLDVDLAVELASDRPVWVPIRLDRQKLSAVDENGKDVMARKTNAQECEVELAGKGEHKLRARVRVAINMNPARKSLSLAIPACASTSLKLEFAQRESDIVIGADENFGKTDIADGKRSIVTALLEPRSSIDVSWSNDADSGRGNSPLLTARGEIEIDVDSEQMRTRSLWDIRSVRGVTRTLEIRLDDADEVTELQLDDRQPVSGIERVREGSQLTVELGDPLRPGSGRRLMMKTRRPHPKQPDHKLTFAGFPLLGARQQSGFIGITESANLWLTATDSPGLRRIYPSLLPQALRERPSTSLAFEFLDQPFALNLEVSPSPPLVKARTRTVFHVNNDRAPSETTIDLEWVRGRLYEVAVDVGPGLELSSIGPPDVVESYQTTALPPNGEWPSGEPGQRKILIRLKSLARDQNNTTLRLSGDQRIPPRDSVKLGLLRPQVSTTVKASYVLYADRAISVEPDERIGRVVRPGDADPALADTLADLMDNPGPESSDAPILIVTDNQDLVLPVHLTRHTRSVARETTLSAQVRRRAVELVQKTTLSVRHGELTSIDIHVPKSLIERWELRDREFASREEIGQDPDGSRHYRLFFKQRPVDDKVTLTFHSLLTLNPALDASQAHSISLPQIACSPGQAQPTKLELDLAPGLVFESGDPKWARDADEIASGSKGAGPLIVYTAPADLDSPPFGFAVRALDAVAVPAVVVPRMMMESVAGADFAVRCRASYWVESHGPSFEFHLPDAARWIGGRLDGRALDHVDQGPSRSTYTLWFPVENESKPALLELEYLMEGAGARAPLQPPELAREALVLESLWDLRLPWESTILLPPGNWSDENQWFWDGYAWKEHSPINRPFLREWLRGATAPAAAGDASPEVDAEGNHRFLFSRVGPPKAMDARVVSKAWVVAVSAGSILILGLLVLGAGLRFRTVWMITAALGLLGSLFVQSSALVLAVEAACAGLFLTLAGFLIQRSIDRARSANAKPREPAFAPAPILPDPSSLRGLVVGSDESTAIRVRVPVTPSTVEYAAVLPPIPQLKDEERNSFLEPA